MKFDNSQMQTGCAWASILQKYNIASSTTEPHNPQQNYAERKIQDLKKGLNIMMDRTGTPDKLWFLCLEYLIELHNHRAAESLKWKTSIEIAFGETPDISSLIQFKWFEYLYYYEPTAEYPDSKERIGRFVGIAPNTGDAMTYKIYIESTGNIIVRGTVRVFNKSKDINVRAMEIEEITFFSEVARKNTIPIQRFNAPRVTCFSVYQKSHVRLDTSDVQEESLVL